jgi:hypothetical protein
LPGRQAHTSHGFGLGPFYSPIAREDGVNYSALTSALCMKSMNARNLPGVCAMPNR